MESLYKKYHAEFEKFDLDKKVSDEIDKASNLGLDSVTIDFSIFQGKDLTWTFEKLANTKDFSIEPVIAVRCMKEFFDEMIETFKLHKYKINNSNSYNYCLHTVKGPIQLPRVTISW